MICLFNKQTTLYKLSVTYYTLLRKVTVCPTGFFHWRSNMSYGIIRVQKFKMSDVTGIQIHDKREKSKSHSNADIDFSKSNQNYSLLDDDDKRPFLHQIKEKIENLNLKKAIRKDAVVMCQILVTSDKKFFDTNSEQTEKEYFKNALEFIKEKYGADNIISAEVHKDEKTPHLHVNLVPINDNKLSAKSLFDRPLLYELQDEFYEKVSRDFFLERGGQQEKKRHKEINKFKKETLLKEEQELDKKEEEIKERKIAIEKIDITSNTEQKYFLKESDIQPQIKSKNLFKKIFETSEEITKRINNKYIYPLIEKVKELQSIASRYERESKENNKERVAYMEKYQDLTKGLSLQGIERLKEFKNKIKQEEELSKVNKKDLSR